MNRKQQITYLENEIAKQNKTLIELKTAEERQEPDEFYPGNPGPSDDLTQEDIADILKNI
jgi:hypothetical protein